MTDEEALELARSILQGKPTEKCQSAFSYVKASLLLSEYILVKHYKTSPKQNVAAT